MTDDLGKRMYAQNIVLRGRLSDHNWREFLIRAVKAIGMTPSGEPAVWRYPTEAGKGGNGITICQPLTESFAVLDTWSDHDGAYLHLASCIAFNVAALVEPAREFCLAADFIGKAEMLRLDRIPDVTGYHWERSERERRDGYYEVDVDEPMHAGAPSDPRFDPIKG
jgi:hypothetical protein